jgi:hypothetical protein
MAKLFFATLCDDVREEKSGKFSLMGIFDRFLVADFRASFPSFWLFAQIGFDTGGDHGLTIEFRRAERAVVVRAETGHQVTGTNSVTGLCHANINMRMEHLTVPGPGPYEFAIQSDGRHIGALAVEIIQPPPQLVQ